MHMMRFCPCVATMGLPLLYLLFNRANNVIHVQFEGFIKTPQGLFIGVILHGEEPPSLAAYLARTHGGEGNYRRETS